MVAVSLTRMNLVLQKNLNFWTMVFQVILVAPESNRFRRSEKRYLGDFREFLDIYFVSFNFGSLADIHNAWA